jgi:invasion protein IalB
MRALSDQVTRLAGDAQTAARQVGSLQSSLQNPEWHGHSRGRSSIAQAISAAAERRESPRPQSRLPSPKRWRRSCRMTSGSRPSTAMNQQLAENSRKARSQLTADDYRDERADRRDL